MEVATKLLEALMNSPLQATISLVIFLLALPLILKGLRDRKEGYTDSHDSPWLILEINNINNTMQAMQRDIESILEHLKNSR